jgi:hypothetical protein
VRVCVGIYNRDYGDYIVFYVRGEKVVGGLWTPNISGGQLNRLQTY